MGRQNICLNQQHIYAREEKEYFLISFRVRNNLKLISLRNLLCFFPVEFKEKLIIIIIIIIIIKTRPKIWHGFQNNWVFIWDYDQTKGAHEGINSSNCMVVWGLLKWTHWWKCQTKCSIQGQWGITHVFSLNLMQKGSIITVLQVRLRGVSVQK